MKPIMQHVFVVLSVLLVSCSSPEDFETTVSLATDPILTYSPAVGIPTLTEENITRLPTATTKVTITSTAPPTMADEEGYIWISPPQNQLVFTKIGVQLGIVEYVELPAGCSGVIATHKKFFCRSSEQELYLIDIASMEKEATPISGSGFLDISSNEQHFLYEVFDEVSGNYVISSYDHINKTSQIILSTPVKLSGRGWFVAPSVSSDGSRLLVSMLFDDSQPFQVFFYAKDNIEAEQLSNLEGYSTGETAWSPTGDKLIFNVIAEDNRQEIYYPQDLFLYDLETEQFNLFEFGAFQPVPGYSAWSPDGARVALVNTIEICIIDVSDVSHDCFDYTESLGNSIIFSYDWSPNGEMLALLVKLEETGDVAVAVFNPANEKIRIITDRVEGLFINWTR
ncbi:MAG: hypothetical protein DWQ07_25165 [Chloroflexi bacterium]|nr:MAG: hypothetical protein DWQ07_25165 [Chloroflexota bacterium]MBL1196174.1 hypothetical protein [Chloroflexota bacterium]NOH13467.1 hypothetical protein [Chloroflexota bacterium]